ncbi:MAG: hypothetical protein WAL63_13520 [Solirubrobacteraceae bacterium]
MTAPTPSGWTARRIVVDGLLVVTTVLTVVAILAVWANRQLLDPHNWERTSTKLLQNDAVRNQTANYVVDQLYNNVNVKQLIGSGLPAPLQGLAGPVSGALRQVAVDGTKAALARPRVQALWAQANFAAAQSLKAIINGGNRHVSVNHGVVTLNLGTILTDVASRLGISANLAAKLPPSAANIVVLRSNQLRAIQDGGKALAGLATVLYILVPLLYILAIALATGRRRRTLIWVGVSGIVAGLVVILARRIAVAAVPNSLVKDASVRPAVRAVTSIASTMLPEIAGAVILIGVLLILAGLFAGPARLAVRGRRVIAPFLRDYPVAVFAIVAAVLLLIFIWQPIPSTGTWVGMLVYTVLAFLGTELLRRQTAQEFPARMPIAGGAGPDLERQLEQLEELRTAGTLTSDDVTAARARLTQGRPPGP